MIKIQIDQYDMVLTTEKHLEKNAGLFASNASLVASKDLLRSKITELKAQIALQLINPKGIAIEKRASRKALEAQAFVLGSACCGYASANAYADLYRRCRYTKSDLLHFRDAELVGICINLKEDVTGHFAALAPYNVNAVMLADFQTAIAKFSEMIPNPLEAVAKKKAATLQIDLLLREILNVLKVRLDNDIVSMGLSHPEFVATYFNARALNKTRTTKRSLVVKTLDATNNMPIPDVDLEIIGKGIRRKSGENGHNRIQNLVSGSHHLRVSHPDYNLQKLNFTIVSGETTELSVLMHKKSEQPLFLNESLVIMEMEHG
jgi:hypothetical protein